MVTLLNKNSTELEDKVDTFKHAENGKACEEPHVASNGGDSSLK